MNYEPHGLRCQCSTLLSEDGIRRRLRAIFGIYGWGTVVTEIGLESKSGILVTQKCPLCHKSYSHVIFVKPARFAIESRRKRRKTMHDLSRTTQVVVCPEHDPIDFMKIQYISKALLAAATLLALPDGAHAIKITVPDQYKDQVEATKAAERKEREQELEGVAEDAESGIQIAGEDKPVAEKPKVDADEFLVQSVIEATDTAAAIEGSLAANEGLVSGQVVDKESGEPVSGVAILIEGSNIATVTDNDGRYTLGPAEKGSYTISFVKSGYIEANVTDYAIAGGQVSVFPFALPPRPADMSDEVYELQDFTVTAEEANQLMALTDLKQASVGQVDFLSSEDFARFAGSNIADLVGRMAGVNVVEGQFAVVRGLGDRYNSTLLNDLPVPSPDPVRQGVQLDLFPTSVVEGVVADKAFTPSLPSNSSGAAFNLITRSYPDEFSGWFEVGFSANENTKKSLLRNGNVDPFQGTPGSDAFDLDAALGRADTMPSGDSVAAINDSVGDGILDFGGRSYKTGFGDTYTAPWGGTVGFITSLSYSSSSSTSIGTQQDRYGRNSFTSPFPDFFPSIPGSQSEGTLPGTGLVYDFTKSTVSEDSAFLFGLGFSLDPEEKHKIDLTYLRSRSNIAEASRRENGYLPDLGADSPDRGFGQSTFSTNTLIIANEIIGRPGSDLLTQGQDILSFEQRALEVKQVAGEHLFEGFGRDLLTLSWGVSDNKASSDIGNPDPNNFVGGQTSLFYLQNATGAPLVGSIGVPATSLPDPVPDGGYIFGGDSAIVDGFTEDVIRQTARTISDDHFAHRMDLNVDMHDMVSMQLGYYHEELERDVLQRDEILVISGANITSGATLDEFIDATLDSPDTFDVELDSFASVTRETSDQYVQFTTALVEDLEVVFGVRASDVSMTASGTSELVPGFPLSGAPAAFTQAQIVGNANLTNADLLGYGSSNPADAIVSGAIDESYLLPAISLKYTVFDNWVIRFSYGETYALPSPRELSPVFTVDTFTGDRLVGNPTLMPSEVENFGARIERTLDDGVTSIGFSIFQKRIQNPVEQIGLSHSTVGIDVQSFINNENTAIVNGVELEGRLGLGVFDRMFDDIDLSFLEYFSIGGNAAFIDASVGYPEAVEISYLNTNTGESIFSDGEGNTKIPNERRLYDQPEWTLNFDISFEQPDWGTSITAAIYAQSDVLTSVGTGSSLTIDQFTSPYHQLDLTLSQTFGDGWELSLSIENVTDSSRGIEYNRELVNDEEIKRFSYKVGRSYGIALKKEF